MVGREVSKQPPWSMATSTTTAPGRIRWTSSAETSFGAHIFNTLTVYRDEPQSYTGRPPGLSTRLFLRLGDEPYDTLCHLIYPASRPLRPESVTEIILHNRTGAEIARTGTCHSGRDGRISRNALA